MAPNADDLAKRVAALSERLSTLAGTLAQATQQLQGGTVPSEALADEITKVRTDFLEVRQRVMEAARSLSINLPATSEIDSLRTLEPLLDAVVQALAAEEKRAALSEARTRVMALLDRVLTITHSDGPNFAAMVQCVVKAKEIRLAAQDPKAFDSEQAPAFLDNIPAFAALLSIIEGRDALDDDKFAVLDEAVTTAFGRTLAVAAARGKLTIGAAKAPAPAPVVERATPPAPKEPAPRPAAPAPAAPARPGVLTSTPAPVPAAAPVRNIIITETRDEPIEAVQARESSPAQPAQPAEQAPHDEAAQWWVPAWARWTKWQGTLPLEPPVKEDLGKFTYRLSVPLQKNTDYEEDPLAN